MDIPKTETESSRSAAVKKWCQSTACLICTSHALSAWGDRMWRFAVGLYLVFLEKDSLLLPAVYGFTTCACRLIFGALIGAWVDRTPRLKVAQTSLILQNLAVTVCAIVLYMTISYQSTIGQGTHLMGFCRAIVIILAVAAQLASLAYKISVEHDWIVVVAKGDKEHLASLNAAVRAIDLTSNILAPIVAGQVMTFGSMLIGAVFIAVWNIVSVFIEYYLLWKVYIRVPELEHKKTKDTEDLDESQLQSEAETTQVTQVEADQSDVEYHPHNRDGRAEVAILTRDQQRERVYKDTVEKLPKDKRRKGVGRLLCDRCIIFVGGWHTYIRQKIVAAGIGLAFLYMTVMGFDSISIGYIYSQGIPEYGAGIFMGLGSLLGILGAFSFTRIRKKIGLERTGLISFSLEIGLLIPALISIWLPGSPFDLSYDPKTHAPSLNCTSHPGNVTILDVSTNITRFKRRISNMDDIYTTFEELTPGELKWYSNNDPLDINGFYQPKKEFQIENLRKIVKRQLQNETGAEVAKNGTSNPGTNNTSTEGPASTDEGPVYIGNSSNQNPECLLETGGAPSYNYISVVVFMTSVVLSRFGLWMADLTVTQLIQENVHESDRGAVNGVQNSLNSLFDLIKFTLVIILPSPHTFGILIILSVLFICLGAVSYAIYSRKVRGHLFHFEKCCGSSKKSMKDKNERRLRVASVENEHEKQVQDIV
ncbi:unnamed protein product [Owenia fusiformis]|uniref:Uncharacterized protein n=1 Tax=Owenia fusiformis TaxID=6347 RepID=A0A8J1YBA1_OWEFU|nr:unnamed protein product [Owenia fusiformis]